MKMLTISKGLALAIALILVVSACSSGGGDGEKATPTTGGAQPTRTSPTSQPSAYKAPHNKPGPAAEKVFFKSFAVERAPLDFQAGQMDFYLFSLKTDGARALRSASGVRLEEAPSTTVSIVMNPAPAPGNQLNPFSIKGVRQAVQYLIDRNFIANDIYQGQAQPMLTHLSPTDFDYATIFETVKASDYRYDPDLAKRMIEREMRQAGAELVGGKWSFRGQPIRIKFIIRVEDERRQVGDQIRAKLEEVGFTVSPSYQQFAPAVQAVYSSDPVAFEWHLYTEGWSRGAPQRYDYASINNFAAPWQGNMPGWREAGFWQYENRELDDIGQRLFTGKFTSADERNDIYRRMTRIALDESVRAWVVTVNNSFPLNDKIQGITEDIVAGPKGGQSIREAYIPGKDELTLGSLWVWTERTTWNPVGGFGDLYSADIWRNIADPTLINDPFTGQPTAFRASFNVETAGPSGKLAVPADAVKWNASANRWEPLGGGGQATSKVVYDYSKFFSSKWHNGQQITMADLMYSIAQGFELAYDPDKARIEFALGATSRPYLDTFRGFRILDGNRIEVYVDFWHFDQAQIGSYAVPSGLPMPWELLYAMDELVFTQRRAAYSDTASARFNVPWISLAIRRDAGLVERALREIQSRGAAPLPEGVFTIGGRSLVSPQEAAARLQADVDWYAKYGHLVIGNGPFFLNRYDPPAQFAELNAFRDPTYPFKPGDWYRGEPPRLEIQRVSQARIGKGRAGEVTADVVGPGKLSMQYVLFDPATSKVVRSGNAEAASATRFTVRLDAATTGSLATGVYQLSLALISDDIASLSERRVNLEITS